jgi:hypothetical protein
VVLVIGAGASREYDLPLGSQLLSQLTSELSFHSGSVRRAYGDDLIRSMSEHAKTNSRPMREYLSAAKLLVDVISRFASVDEALHYLSGTSPLSVTIGKAALAKIIIRAEAKSTIRVDPRNGRVDAAAVRSGWVSEFLKIALAGTRAEDIRALFANVTIININYDRVIEHLIHTALIGEFGLTSEVAAEVVEGIEIIRPYGVVAPLRWQNERGIAFGEEVGLDYFGLASNIRTFTEKHIHDQKAIGTAIDNASQLICLGFGFHPQNVGLLKLDEGGRRATSNYYIEMIGTTFGIDERTNGEIVRHFDQHCKVNSATLVPWTAVDALDRLGLKIKFLVGTNSG